MLSVLQHKSQAMNLQGNRSLPGSRFGVSLECQFEDRTASHETPQYDTTNPRTIRSCFHGLLVVQPLHPPKKTLNGVFQPSEHPHLPGKLT